MHDKFTNLAFPWCWPSSCNLNFALKIYQAVGILQATTYSTTYMYMYMYMYMSTCTDGGLRKNGITISGAGGCRE